MFGVAGRQDFLENHLLRLISTEEYEHLRASMRHTPLTLGQVLYEPGGLLDHVYFPTTCVVSCLYTMHDGSTAEMSLVGNDGIVGVAILLGGSTMPHRAVVQIGGNAIKIPARVLQASLRAVAYFNVSCCATCMLSLSRSHKRPSATACIP